MVNSPFKIGQFRFDKYVCLICGSILNQNFKSYIKHIFFLTRYLSFIIKKVLVVNLILKLDSI